MRRNKEEESRRKKKRDEKCELHIFEREIRKLFLIHTIISRPFVCTSSEGSGDTSC